MGEVCSDPAAPRRPRPARSRELRLGSGELGSCVLRRRQVVPRPRSESGRPIHPMSLADGQVIFDSRHRCAPLTRCLNPSKEPE